MTLTRAHTRAFAFLASVLFSFCAIAQQKNDWPAPGSARYEQMKKSGTLPRGIYVLPAHEEAKPLQAIIHPAPASSVACECMIPLDGSFSVVPFTIGTPPDYRNDDGSSPLINLPFSFCFYGQQISSCYINNNGNISFGAPYPVFSANAFPDPNFVMVAPFWGDVDTRSLSSGLVHYKITPTSMIVKWSTVDFFQAIDPSHVSLYNNFQLIITDGADPLLPPGNNVSFCYGDMQWTTGDASGGTGGFGGVAATVGVNQGNGTDYIQIGQFDAAGTLYDGPFGSPDQVSWLDNQTFYFDVCSNNGNNLPPIINSAQICDTIEMCAGDTLDIAATFLSPEQGQVTSITVNAGSIQGYTTFSNQSGNTASLAAQLIAFLGDTGYHSITITGTDNGNPGASTSANVVVHIIAAPNVNFSWTPSPVLVGVPAQFTDLTSGATQWSWNFGDGDTSSMQDPSHSFTAPGTYTVTLTAGLPTGCNGTSVQFITVLAEPVILPVTPPNIFTPNGDGKNDALEFANLLQYKNSHLEIYNRWGLRLYESFDYRNDWRPDHLSDGVYYFLLYVPEIDTQLSGFVHLIR